jgi:hypothetical protein
MSGGSFNYLFLKRGAELLGAAEDIRSMRDTLVGMDPRRGLPEAIRDLDELLRLAGIDSPVNAIADRMEGVMRAVEWWQSCDARENDVTAALAKMKASGEPESSPDPLREAIAHALHELRNAALPALTKAQRDGDALTERCMMRVFAECDRMQGALEGEPDRPSR